MPVLNNVLINGTNYSWANLKCVIGGVPLTQITKIDYKRTQAKTDNHGWGTEVVSRGYGNVSYAGSLTLFVDEWRRIIASSPNNDPLSIPPFQIQVHAWNLPGSSSQVSPILDTLYNVEFTNDELVGNQGDEKLMVEIPLIFAGLTHDLA